MKIKIKSAEYSCENFTADEGVLIEAMVEYFASAYFSIAYKKGFLRFNQGDGKASEPKLLKKLTELATNPTVSTHGANAGAYMALLPRLLAEQWSAANAEDRVAQTLPTEIKQFLWPWVRWFATSTGERTFQTRTHSTYKCWEISTDPLASLSRIAYDPTQTVLEYLSNKLLEMQKSGETEFGVTEDTNPETGIVHRTLTPLLVACDDRILQSIKTDQEFVLPHPTRFTNDPLVDSSCFFPLSNIKLDPLPETYEAWTDFESQMPPWAVGVWRACFYGIFCDSNRSRQMVILVDSGQTGKSNMVRAITESVMGNFYCAVSKDSFINNFWGGKILGRRLIVFSDSGNSKISMMDKMKQISGGDPMDVELKHVGGQIPYTPNARVLITTNNLPEVQTFAKHQTSRQIIIPLTRTKDEKIRKKFCALDEKGDILKDSFGDDKIVGAPYHEWMKAQLFEYLGACLPYYNKLCPTGLDVVVPDEMLQYVHKTCASTDAEAITYLMEECIMFDPKGQLGYPELSLLVQHAAETTKDSLSYREFKRYLQISGCETKRDKLKRWIIGVSLRPNISLKNDRVEILQTKMKLETSQPVEIQ